MVTPNAARQYSRRTRLKIRRSDTFRRTQVLVRPQTAEWQRDRAKRSDLKPSTVLRLHRALIQRKYRRLFSSNGPTRPGPKGPSRDVIAPVVDMKQRNPSWGCPRIAHQFTLAFGIPMNKDAVRRILAVRHQPTPDSAGRPG
jgi:hypothetical protein